MHNFSYIISGVHWMPADADPQLPVIGPRWGLQVLSCWPCAWHFCLTFGSTSAVPSRDGDLPEITGNQQQWRELEVTFWWAKPKGLRYFCQRPRKTNEAQLRTHILFTELSSTFWIEDPLSFQSTNALENCLNTKSNRLSYHEVIWIRDCLKGLQNLIERKEVSGESWTMSVCLCRKAPVWEHQGTPVWDPSMHWDTHTQDTRARSLPPLALPSTCFHTTNKNICVNIYITCTNQKNKFWIWKRGGI